jgi:hypothetical protein
MSYIIWYRPLNGLGDIRADLDAPGTVRHIFDDDDEKFGFGRGLWGRVTFALYRLPNGKFIEHFWRPDQFSGDPQFDPDECEFHEIQALEVEEMLGWLLEAPQASLSDPARETVSLSPSSTESTPEADADVWISFAAAHEMTGLESYQITRA